MTTRKIKFLFYGFVFLVLLTGFLSAKAQDTPIGAEADIGTVDASQESGKNRIGAGEILPVSIKLVNFGSQKRVDVIVNYKIFDSNNNEIYSESETVAVETTAGFVKKLQLPYNIKPGTYSLMSSLIYPDQQQPAESKFFFRVERKFAGFFVSDLILYIIVILFIILIAVAITYTFTALNKRRSLVHDYTDKPKNEIIYYEILSDVISQMRLRIGNDALEIAKGIPDLEINDKNGLVVNIKKNPAKIVALLIDRYEEATGSRVSFSLPQKTHNI